MQNGARAGWALAVLVGFIFVVYAVTVVRTLRSKGDLNPPNFRGLYLPQGSIRGLLAFSVVGAFIVFVFFGGEAIATLYEASGVETDVDGIRDMYDKGLSVFGTLAASITGFYFGGRLGQHVESDSESTN